MENYTQGHADGISLTFLLIWFVGDVTNLTGAAWAGLVPTVIALAVYFCFADFVLIGQCLYYNTVNRRKEAEQKEEAANGEQQPLLQGNDDASKPAGTTRRLTDVTEENMGLPGSRRRRTTTTSSHSHRRNSLERILEEPTRTRAWLKNSLSILLIFAAGAGGWAIAWKTGAWRPTPAEHQGGEGGARGPLGAEILGYISAVLYLGARIPQIIKNQRERSCEGLSLLFFLLSVMGNATYGAGVSTPSKGGRCDADGNVVDSLPFRAAGVLSDEPAVVDRLAGHDCGGYHYFCAVFCFWGEG